MSWEQLPLRRVLLQPASAAVDVGCLVAAWLLEEPPPVLRAGTRLSTSSGVVRIISCHPTPTGTLHRKTRVLVAAATPEGDADCPPAAAVVRLAGYIGRLLLPVAPAPLLLAFLCVWSLRRRGSLPQPLRPVSAAELLRRAGGAACDSDGAAVVSAVVLKRLGAASGEWRRCEVRVKGALRRTVWLQLVQARVDAEDGGAAYVSTALWWNLGLRESDTVALYIPAAAAPPPEARAARVAQVAGPTQMALQSCQAALQAHFSRPRLLLPGQVITSRQEDPESGRCLTACFRVESVEAATPEADVTAGLVGRGGVTSLYQVSDVTAAVPPPQPVRNCPWEPGQVPAHLEPVWGQLCDLLSASSAHHRPLVAVCGSPGSGVNRVVAAAAAQLGRHLVTVEAGSLSGDTSGAAASRVQQQLSRGRHWRCLLHLTDAHQLGRDRETGGTDRRVVSALLEAAASLPLHAAVVLSCPSADGLVPELRAHVTHELAVAAPDAAGREQLLQWLSRRQGVRLDWLTPRRLSLQTAGYLLGDLDAVIAQAKYSALACLEDWCEQCDLPTPARLPPLCLDADNFKAGVEFVRARQAESAGAPQIPDTRWQDVGGLAEVKQEVVDLIQLPLSHPHLFTGAAARSGILLYGPPGTGKTLVAKAVATECGLSFLSVKGPELINMYVGQSEANVRDVFRRARDAAPSIIFFDELDSLAPNRGRTGDSGGVMDRVVSQFLAELDGAVTSGQVYVIGATNRPDLIDPALLRPGRFDRLLYLGPSRTRASHLAILRAQTRRLAMSEDVCLEAVVQQLPEALTGADVYALCEQATCAALDRAVHMVENGEATEESAPIQVTQKDLLEAAATLAPSLGPDQLREYDSLRQRVQGAA